MKSREKLFDEGERPTLERAINIARYYEASQAQLKAMNPAGNEGKKDVISHAKSRNIRPKHSTFAQAAQQRNPKSTQAGHRHREENQANICDNCGRSHSKSETCPARGQTCNYCKKKGHFIQVCKKRMRSKQRIHEIQVTATSFEENFETLALEPICVGIMNQEIKAHKDEVFATVNVDIAGREKEETTLKAKIDTTTDNSPSQDYTQTIPSHVTPGFKPFTANIYRIIIPKALQNEILLKLHASHQGTEKTKLRARSAVYWRDLNRDINNVTKSCSICQDLQNKKAKGPSMPTEIFPRPWHTVSPDLFYLDGSEYLLVADYYSKFIFIRNIPPGKSTSKTVIELMKQICSEHGIPYVKYPIDGKLPSPGELLLGRPLQDNLPRRIQASPNDDDIAARLEYRQGRQRHYHDTGCKSLPDLVPGQPITIQDPLSSTWKPAIVKERLDKVPRSYTATTPGGQELRRNLKHVMEVPPMLNRYVIRQAPKPEDLKPRTGKETRDAEL
ncbi:Uncharacterized protein K02A2.6 [Stylophora pistillata]|uniref:Uncharacterized protein K02A2.6 n=1 Tax=Stylophora pistillata TaxID=50429 RepID=A0A2B4R7P9_STYPI|nr:Uncharacterized protein K02A2.6 [Stylophora pistillata]